MKCKAKGMRGPKYSGTFHVCCLKKGHKGMHVCNICVVKFKGIRKAGRKAT